MAPPDTAAGLTVWLIILTSAVIGTAAGLLSWLGGVRIPLAILAGGGAFGGSVLLIITLLNYAAGQ